MKSRISLILRWLNRNCFAVRQAVRVSRFNIFKLRIPELLKRSLALRDTKHNEPVVGGIWEPTDIFSYDPMGGMISVVYAGRPRFGKVELLRRQHFGQFIETPQLDKKELSLCVVSDRSGLVNTQGIHAANENPNSDERQQQ